MVLWLRDGRGRESSRKVWESPMKLREKGERWDIQNLGVAPTRHTSRAQRIRNMCSNNDQITKKPSTSKACRIFIIAPNSIPLASTHSYRHVLSKYAKKWGKTWKDLKHPPKTPCSPTHVFSSFCKIKKISTPKLGTRCDNYEYGIWNLNREIQGRDFTKTVSHKTYHTLGHYFLLAKHF